MGEFVDEGRRGKKVGKKGFLVMWDGWRIRKERGNEKECGLLINGFFVLVGR